jgi:hypothetical protein
MSPQMQKELHEATERLLEMAITAAAVQLEDGQRPGGASPAKLAAAGAAAAEVALPAVGDRIT